MKIPPQYESLRFEHDISWSDIFAVWRAGEAYQKDWKKHWTQRGFDSWDAWRENYARPTDPVGKQWAIYRIAEPQKDVPLMFGVPSRGWQEKCYGGEKTKMIAEILTHPIVADNSKMAEVKKKCPYQTMLTGVIHEGKIVLIEGMHRACALARMESFAGDAVIALAEMGGELPTLGTGVGRG